MGLKLFKKNKKKKNEQIARDAFKAAETPTKVGAGNAAVTTPDTIASPGSPVPQQDYIMEASTPNAMNIERPEPTSFNQRIMESETPLVSNLATASSVSSQFGRERSAPRLDNTNTQPLQTKSNQIRDEIGQYYDMRDREDAREMMAKKPTEKMHGTKTFAVQSAVGVRAFSVDEAEDVEVQLLKQSNYATTQRTNISIARSRSGDKLVPKFVSKPNQDEVSIPSVITDPEGTSVKGLSVVDENEVLKETQQQEPESTWAKVSLKNKVIDGGQSIDDAIKSLFSTDQKTSAATQAGGIEQLLGFLQCAEDTTCGPVLQCDTLCGAEVKEKDVVDLEIEQEQQFAMKFNSVRDVSCSR